jgi:hypothetical protein
MASIKFICGKMDILGFPTAFLFFLTTIPPSHIRVFICGDLLMFDRTCGHFGI